MPTTQELLEKLEERFILGEISEENYNELKSKLLSRIKDDSNSPSTDSARQQFCGRCGRLIKDDAFRCEGCKKIYCLECRVEHPDGLTLPLCKGCAGPMVEKLKEERTAEEERKRKEEEERRRQKEANRFKKDSNGIITDTRTGLEWYVDPDRDTTWDDAKLWVEGLTVDGGRWRMPTLDELEGLYKEGVGDRNMDPAFKTSGIHVWSDEGISSSSEKYIFLFDVGFELPTDRDLSGGARAFAVRSR